MNTTFFENNRFACVDDKHFKPNFKVFFCKKCLSFYTVNEFLGDFL